MKQRQVYMMSYSDNYLIIHNIDPAIKMVEYSVSSIDGVNKEILSSQYDIVDDKVLFGNGIGIGVVSFKRMLDGLTLM